MKSTAEIINILCTTDDNYVPYCGIMLTSLFETNPQSNLHIYIICQNLSNTNQRNLTSLVNKYGNHINFVKINEEDVKGFPIRKKDHVSLATYYRLFAPIILPENIDRILYLDCDMIVDGRIDELYKSDINGFALAGVLDEDYLPDEKYNRLHIWGDKRYFNAGMLLINLEYWRANNIWDKCMNCINTISDKLLLHDQDTLNVVLQNQIKLVSVKYNLQTGFLYKKTPLEDVVKNDIAENLQHPIIIHYTGSKKPWLLHYHHPYLNHFRYYRSISIWKNCRLTVTLKNEWRYIRHSIKFALKLKEYPYITKPITRKFV